MTSLEPSAANTKIAPKILFFDTEIAKSIYAKFPPKGRPEFDSYHNIIKDWWLICAAWKWNHSDKVEIVSVLSDPKRFKKNPTDDFHVVKTLYDEISKADALVGHNMEGFDWKKFYARVLYYDLPPLDKPKIIDTLRLAKSVAEFTSNSLDYITKYLKLPQKAHNRGNAMWNDVVKYIIEGNMAAAMEVIREVEVYCPPDVTACEALYYKLLPHVNNRYLVNMNVYSEGKICCPKCGSTALIKRGPKPSGVHSYQCKDCKGYCNSKTAIRVELK